MKADRSPFIFRPTSSTNRGAFPSEADASKNRLKPGSRGVAKSLRLAFYSLGLVFSTLTLPAFGQGNISTVAGGATQGSSGSGGLAVNADLWLPQSVVFDTSGNYYIADPYKFIVWKVNTAGTITIVAGNGTQGNTINIGTNVATDAALGLPVAVAVDSSGNLYIADQQLSINCVWKVTTSGNISVVAGNGVEGFAGDGGAAVNAALDQPGGVAIDTTGNLYIADTGNQRIRKVNTSGTISTFAGTGMGGYLQSQDGGPATKAEINEPAGLTVDSSGNLYIADFGNNLIRKVNTSGIISTVAGGAGEGCSGNFTTATKAALFDPSGVAIDRGGNLYIADQFNNRVSKVNPAGILSTVAGYGCGGADAGYNGDGIPATKAELNFPSGVATDNLGNVYIADTDNFRVRKTAALVPVLSSEMDTPDNKNAVYYLGFDSNLYELASNAGWKEIQATGTNSRPAVAASAGIATYVNTIYDGNEVFYTTNASGQLHIEQLYGSSLSPTDLTKLTSGKAMVPGSNLVGYIDTIANTDNVFFLGRDQLIHVLTWSPSGGWKEDATLDSTSRPAAAVGSPLSGHLTAAGEEIFYLGANQHVYELWRWSQNFDGWHSADVTSLNGTKPLAAPGSPLAGFYDSVAGDDAVFYLGIDQHVHELLFASSEWTGIDVTATAKAPNAGLGSALAAHRDTLSNANSEEVFFVDSNQNVQELWAYSSSPTSWNSSNVTAASGGAALAAQGTALTTNISTLDNTDHVFYVAASDEYVHELWWNGTWHTDAVNTQTNPIAPVAVP